ncbi:MULTISPECIES: hypothetical protein [unclassified Rhizobacter]|uniref:hypothetical protein n=1 Tax=unclassified Rhizobacter TaxID=2640088 RepID=UPI0006F9C9EC|nr:MULTISPECIES: hypothetical protein [unclassified Rhizobacter]KQU67102.1 hypothetical protein ASC88_08780 [Rhizobacter sp. Root29]KQV98187.1 hypothetical protein ASC98_09285 [Rhizobacter sp. Root1238]KRB02085.1 hypothetical protein ASE08_16845 [Rhizobacter sp. Root16D2]
MNLPAELDPWFARIAVGDYAGRLDVELNLLDRAQATEWTGLLTYHPIVGALGGIVLDDPETSNHHIYASRSPLQGSVFYLAHDDDSRIVYASLGDFLAAADEAKRRQAWLSQLHPACSPVAADQAGLSRWIGELIGSHAGHEVAMALVPSLDLADTALLRRLVNDPDFFLGEAVAVEIEKRPARALGVIAELCTLHPHPQVVSAGRLAARAIAKLR